MVTLTDKSIMTWGKYKGYVLVNVPASYLIYIYVNFTIHTALKKYIEDNLGVLKMQAKNDAKERYK